MLDEWPGGNAFLLLVIMQISAKTQPLLDHFIFIYKNCSYRLNQIQSNQGI